METAESTADKTKDTAAAAADKSKGAYEASKEKVGEGVDSASGASEDAAKAGLKITSDGAEKVQSTADSKHEEL